ncbi:SusC/RagA family TonB-linked outer membrane protein [Leyella lascolaii]|uniref:SusC/RagA family TonB-linked outer membrane protein n=1 Tax=Leyella lascolaii TaxID=1776379 RepID=UPI002354BFCC|nr:TonB-dependent receptor [Leyella lascolaii]
MKQRLTMFFACLFLSIGMALAQSRLTGTVTSAEDGQPVVGASVKAKGLNAGAVTNVDGEFTINVPVGTELEITYLGMVPKTVKAANNMRIVLESDSHTLEGVVVTGYGSARKLGTIAGSVSSVSGDALSLRPSASVSDALQGQVAGLQVFTSSGEPSAVSSMTIRGVTSINASTEPLYILDGSEISANTFVSLNPNDIENITVLKDASSTAIYGSRAANGVVIVTSKKGKFGEAPTVLVSAQYSVSEVAHDGTEVMDASQWFKFQEMINPSNLTNESFQAMKNYYQKYNIGTDWVDRFLGNTSPISQIDASVRGGSQNTAYLVSFSHYDADGLYDDSNMRRETLRANLEFNITPWLKVGTNSNLAYNKTQTTLVINGETTSVYNKPWAAHAYFPTQTTHEILGLAYNPDGTIDYANSAFNGYGEKLKWYSLNLGGRGSFDPDYLASKQPEIQRRVRINENAYVNISPIKGLNLRSSVGLDWNDLRVSYKCYNLVDDGFGEQMPTGQASEQFSNLYRWTVTNTAEYKFNFLDDHDVTVLLGQESMTNKTESFGVMRTGLVDNRLMLLSSTSEHSPLVPSHSISEEVRNSWFGMLNYSYADKYFLDLSIRRDGSSLFAKDHRWGTFGAAALMWNVSNESFMDVTKDWLKDLQFRVSYGSTGNSGIDPYLALGLVGASGSMYVDASGTVIANASNADLTWEKVKTFNIGLSGRLFDRVDFDLQYYDKVTSDMLMSIPYSYTTGFSAGYGNVAEMYNRGFDFTIGVDIIKNKDWYWNVKVNGNYNKNKVTKLFQGLDSYVLGDFQMLEVGHDRGEYYMVRWSHVDPADGQSVWLDKDGNYTKIYSEANRVQTGKSWVAPWSGGLSTTVAWKGLQLDVQFTGMFDRYMFNNERMWLEDPQANGTYNLASSMLNMWMKPGDKTSIPAANAVRQADTMWLEDASFVRLKYLQLSYTLPKNWLDQTGFIKGAKVFLVGRNLLTFTGYKGYDPEVNSTKTFGNYPNTRQYSIGAQLTF